MSAKRVILYRPPPRAHVTPFPQRTVPVGLMTIASTLRTRGNHDVRLVDGFEGEGPETLARLARDWGADVVGVSGMTAHAYDAMVAEEARRESEEYEKRDTATLERELEGLEVVEVIAPSPRVYSIENFASQEEVGANIH